MSYHARLILCLCVYCLLVGGCTQWLKVKIPAEGTNTQLLCPVSQDDLLPKEAVRG
jgi:hypothetical protein